MYSSDQPPTTFSWRGFPVVWLFIHHQWISFMYLLSLPFNTYQLYASTKSLKKEFHRSVTHTLRSLLLLFVFSLAPGFIWQPLVFVLGHTVKSYPVSPSMSFLLQNEGPQPIHTLSVPLIILIVSKFFFPFSTIHIWKNGGRYYIYSSRHRLCKPAKDVGYICFGSIL